MFAAALPARAGARDLFAALTAPCGGDCAVAIYGGSYVMDPMEAVLVTDPAPPWNWDIRDDHLVAAAVSRRVGQLWGRVDLEPEVGFAQRFGRQSESEIWGAVFFRYRGFPWDGRVVTSVAVSTGLNYATGVSDIERDRSADGVGSRVMHFFSPEVTLALPQAPGAELVFRLHHRSGVYGLISEARGGAQYATVGVRIRF